MWLLVAVRPSEMRCFGFLKARRAEKPDPKTLPRFPLAETRLTDCGYNPRQVAAAARKIRVLHIEIAKCSGEEFVLLRCRWVVECTFRLV